MKIVVPVFGVLYAFQRSGRARFGPVGEGVGVGVGVALFAGWRPRREGRGGDDAWAGVARLAGTPLCRGTSSSIGMELKVFVPVLSGI